MSDNCRKARAAILGRVRQSLGGAPRLPVAQEVATPPATNLSADRAELIRSFAAELTALSGVFHRCLRAEVATVVLDVLAQVGATRLLAWPDENLPIAGLLDALQRKGVTLLGGDVPLDGSARTDQLALLETAQAGLTGAEAALADIGGIVVRSGAGRARLASLLPPVHIALITPDELCPSLYDWMETLRARGRLQETFAGVSNLTVIAGPSRTADIEKMLVLGVHGPKALHVILVEERRE